MSLSLGTTIAAAAKLVSLLVEKSASTQAAGIPPSVPNIELISVPGHRYTVGAFSTRNKAFHKHVHEIQDIIHHYVARPAARKPLNLLISAPPGSGKSFLVKQLLGSRDSKGARIPYLELNVANIAKRSDLGAAWTFIRTMSDNRIVPCVFFDEIDAEVEGDYLFKDLIMPMYDAAVIHDGAKLALGPAVFIFAGSKLFEPPPLKDRAARGKTKVVNFNAWRIEKEVSIRGLGVPTGRRPPSKSGSAHAVPKIRDFLDRIDRCVIFPDPIVTFDGMDEKVKSYEAIDLVLSMIHRHFVHVVGVAPTAAAALALALQGGGSKRSAERLVFTSTVPAEQTILQFSHLPTEAQNLLPAGERRRLERKHQGKAYTLA